MPIKYFDVDTLPSTLCESLSLKNAEYNISYDWIPLSDVNTKLNKHLSAEEYKTILNKAKDLESAAP